VRKAPDRCFPCKDELFTPWLAEVGREERGFTNIISWRGNVADLGDYVPAKNADLKHEVARALPMRGPPQMRD